MLRRYAPRQSANPTPCAIPSCTGRAAVYFHGVEVAACRRCRHRVRFAVRLGVPWDRASLVAHVELVRLLGG